jgi:hypothetical protein
MGLSLCEWSIASETVVMHPLQGEGNTQRHVLTFCDLTSYLNLCQCHWVVLIAMFTFRNLLMSSTILGLLSISTWFMPNCYLCSLFNVYSFLNEPCFTSAQLQCLAWIHLTQDISTKNGHSGNVTNIPPKTSIVIICAVFLYHHF